MEKKLGTSYKQIFCSFLFLVSFNRYIQISNREKCISCLTRLRNLLFQIEFKSENFRIRLGFTRARIRPLKKAGSRSGTDLQEKKKTRIRPPRKSRILIRPSTKSGSYLIFTYKNSPFTFIFRHKSQYN